MQILCFGDSITWGAYDKDGGWTERLKRSAFEEMESHPNKWIQVYNLGISGDGIDGLIQRFSNETRPRVTEGVKPTFLFSCGANDATFLVNKNAFRSSLDEFEKKYRKIIAEAKQWSDAIFLLTITPVDEEKLESGDKVRKNEFVTRYNEVIKRLAADEHLGLIDVSKAYSLNEYRNLLGDDGLHPNTRGHEVIFSLVKDQIAF